MLPFGLQVSRTIDYRPEIDGLRAFAVVAVVFFHAGFPGFRGGFVGVDIFFVISGYLIGAILLRQIDAGTFRFPVFWLRRVRRLMPALVAMLAGTMAAGLLMLTGDDLRLLSSQTLSALTGWANLWMQGHAGDYWGRNAEGFPLLHTWSLAVEEQFYLILPLGLAWLRRKSGRGAWGICLALAAASLVFSVGATRLAPASGFYLLPSRMWELLAGTLLALREVDGRFETELAKARRWLGWAGILALGGAVVWMQRGRLFPAPAGLLPVVAAMLLIEGLRSEGLLRRMMASGPVVYVGRISYSWYLWHWPVLVFARPVMGEGDGVGWVALSFVLGAASYHFVEGATRGVGEERIPTRILTPVAVLGAFLVAVPHLGLRPVRSFPVPEYWADADANPLPSDIPWKAVESGLVGDWRRGMRARGDTNETVDVVVIGDSNAVMWLPAVREGCRSRGLTLASFGVAATTTFYVPEGADVRQYYFGSNWTDSTRREFDAARREGLRRLRPRVVLLCVAWSTLADWGRERFERELAELIRSAGGARVVVIGQPPSLPFGEGGIEAARVELGPWTSTAEPARAATDRKQVHGWIRDVAGRVSNVRFVETEARYLRGDRVVWEDAGQLIYVDNGHLSVAGALRSVDLFGEAVGGADPAR